MSSRLSLCGVAAPPVLAALVLLAERLTPGYNPLSQTVSQLATEGRPYPGLVNAGFVLYGLLVSGFALGLYRLTRHHSRARAICLLFALYGAGMLLSGVFRDDPVVSAAGASLEARLHNAFSLAGFLAMLAAMVLFAGATRTAPAWRGSFTFSVAVVAVLLFLSPFPNLEVFKPVEGMLQRVSHLLLPLWVEVIALRAVRVARAGTGA